LVVLLLVSLDFSEEVLLRDPAALLRALPLTGACDISDNCGRPGRILPVTIGRWSSVPWLGCWCSFVSLGLNTDSASWRIVWARCVAPDRWGEANDFAPMSGAISCWAICWKRLLASLDERLLYSLANTRLWILIVSLCGQNGDYWRFGAASKIRDSKNENYATHNPMSSYYSIIRYYSMNIIPGGIIIFF
jgi:hypothetical protein